MKLKACLLALYLFPLALCATYIPAQSHFLATQGRHATKKADTLEHRKRLLPWQEHLPKVMPWLLMYNYVAKFP